MSKVDRQKITRGVKLIAPEHLSVMTDIETEVEAGTITYDQLETNWAPWTMLWDIPYLDSMFFEGTTERMYPGLFPDVPLTDIPSIYLIPFIPFLPQEYFRSETTLGVPQIVLNEVQLSFDQRSEPYAISDHHAGVVDPWAAPDAVAGEGMFYPDEVARLNVAFSIYEHQPTGAWSWGGGSYGSANMDPEAWCLTREIFSAAVPGVPGYSSASYRYNPAVRSDLNIRLDPHKSYVIGIRCPQLFNDESLLDAQRKLRLALVNVMVQLKGRSRLMARDVNTGSAVVNPKVQNIPTQHHGIATPPTLAIDLPEAGDPIDARTAEGFSTNYEELDSYFRHKIGGGYSRWSHNHGDTQAISDDAAWFCLPIPMWQNQRNGEVGPLTIDFVNEVGATHVLPIMVKRRIRIGAPFTIHHVVAALNWQTAQQTASYGSALFDGTWIRHTVNVGIGRGLRADSLDLQDVAYLQWWLDDNAGAGTVTPHMLNLIDRIGWPHTHNIVNGLSGSPHDAFCLELMSIPLVNAGTNGSGFSLTAPITGKPFFVGQARTSTQTRTECAIASNPGASRIANTAGMEQWVEVRWEIYPGDGDVPALGDWDAVWNALYTDQVWVGFQGFWVYLIGKKHLIER